MKNCIKLRRRGLFLVILAEVLLILSLSVGAYLYGSYQFTGGASIKVDMFFDNLTQEAKQIYQNNLNANLPEGQKLGQQDPTELEWGHIGNPYVISNAVHLENLSRLQNSGFFAENFPKTDPATQETTFTRNDMPYFLICAQDYTPVVVGGTSIAPVGTDRYPFIGSVVGVRQKNSAYTLHSGKTVDTSAIDNVTVNASGGQIDVGLFGKIGCLGFKGQSTGTFNGIPAELRNLVFSDVLVNVTGAPAAHDGNHRYYVNLFDDPAHSIDVQETNHLGILVGHVEYANVKDLSVYYSMAPTETSRAAVNLTSGSGNYLCGMGFFGLLDHMNPTKDTATGGIVAGTGTDSSEFGQGLDGGGGMKSGTKPGYIRAKEIYNNYGGTTGDLYLLDAKKGNQPLVQESLENRISGEKPAGFFFYDGVFTFALSDGQDRSDPATLDRITDIWMPPSAKSIPYMVMSELDPNEIQWIEEQEKTEIPVTFLCQPENLVLTVWGEGEEMPLSPEKGNSFLLRPGTYYYCAECQGYEPIFQESFTVDEKTEKLEIQVTMVEETDGEETVPSTEETAPSTEETEPSGETVPSTEAMEPSGETVPSTEETEPAGETVPSAGATEPSGETVPSTEETEPSAETDSSMETAAPTEEAESPQEKDASSGESGGADTVSAAQEIHLPELGITVLPGIPLIHTEGAGVLVASNLTAVATQQPEQSGEELLETGELAEGQEKIQTTVPTEQKLSDEVFQQEMMTVQVAFDCKPTDLVLTVWEQIDGQPDLKVPEDQKKEGTTTEKNIYLLAPGRYFYSAEAEGYESVVEQSFMVEADRGDFRISVELVQTQTDPTTESTTEPTVESTTESTTEPTVESMTESTTEPAEENIRLPNILRSRSMAPLKAAPTDSNGVPSFELSKNWQVGQRGENIIYYQRVAQVKDSAELDALIELMSLPKDQITPDMDIPNGFYIGRFDVVVGQEKMKFVDLTKEAVEYNVKKGVAGKESLGELKRLDPTIAGDFDKMRYSSEEEREKEKAYLAKIQKNGDGTYTISQKSGNIKLGIYSKYTGNLTLLNNVIASTEAQSTKPGSGFLHTYFYDFKFNLSSQQDQNSGDWLWTMTGQHSNHNVQMASQGKEFNTGLGSSSVGICIYAVYDYRWVNKDTFYMIPQDQNTALSSLPANQYVLWPQQVYRGNTSGKKSGSSYSLRHLGDLGWTDDQGNPVWPKPKLENGVISGNYDGLSKMFDMKKSVDWSYQLKLGNIVLPSWGQDGKILQVTVGTAPLEKVVGVPTGALAFHVNKEISPANPAYIRIIVKIPTFNNFQNVPDSQVLDYYLGIWKGQVKDKQNTIQLFGFNKDNAQQFVELPLSQQMIPIGDFDAANPPKVPEDVTQEVLDTRGISVTYPHESTDPKDTYKTYLQGDSFMLAYEFTITEPGVYIVATASTADDNHPTLADKSPLQIAYCAADGIASAGRDGSGGSKLGNVDFVYHNRNNQVIPVTEGAPKNTAENETTVNQMYFRSNLLIHFNNIPATGGIPQVNNETLKIYRSILGKPSNQNTWTGSHVKVQGQDQVGVTTMGSAWDEVTFERPGP